MGLLTPDPGLLFWMIIVFGVVFFILAKYGFPVIIKMVEDRKAYIDNSLKAAREANEQLANVKAEGEKNPCSGTRRTGSYSSRSCCYTRSHHKGCSEPCYQ